VHKSSYSCHLRPTAGALTGSVGTGAARSGLAGVADRPVIPP